MNLWKEICFCCRALFGKHSLDAEMAEEMREHLLRLTEVNLASGLTPKDAYDAARRQFGGIDQIKEIAREQRGVRWIEDIGRDLRKSARLMAKQPGFVATAVGILTLCIGANLTIFAVLNSIVLRPLPFPDADRLVTIFNTYPKAGVDRDGASLTNYYERRGQLSTFSQIAIIRPDSAIVGEAGTTERVDAARISPQFFKALGVVLSLGREFSDEEADYQRDRVVILTHGYWRDALGADPRVLGRELRVDGVAKKIVGVLPPNFCFLSSTARLFVPYASSASERAPSQRHSGDMITMIGRLKPGISIAEAEAELAVQDASLAESYPQAKRIADAGFRSVLASLQADHVQSVRPVLWLLQAGAFLLLLIGSLNLVNLLLIRASGRAKEFAIRQSMGATRRHIVSEVMSETVLLSLAGGVGGLGLAWFGIRMVAKVGPDRLPLGAGIAFDAPLAIGAMVGAAILGALLAFPLAWVNFRAQVADGLQASSRSSTVSRAAQKLRHGFIVTQIALALVLLMGAGLLGLSLRRVMAVSPGFRPDHTLVGQLTLPWKNYHGAAYLVFADKLLAELRRQPGVVAASLSTKIPLTGTGVHSGKLAVTVKGHWSTLVKRFALIMATACLATILRRWESRCAKAASW